MYSIVHKGEVLDWNFKVDFDGFRHCFYIGNVFVGQIFKMKSKTWTIVGGRNNTYPLHGFVSRRKAALALLFLEGYQNKEN